MSAAAGSFDAAAPGGAPPTVPRFAAGVFAAPLMRSAVTAYLTLIVLIPLAAVMLRSSAGGWDGFARAVTAPQAVAALQLSLVASAAVVLINAVVGTVIAWVLVRDDFPGKSVVNALIDLPFALPTIVAGLTLVALYGQGSPLGFNLAFTRAAVFLALLFVTLPFVVRAVQPVLAELDREMEEAALALGASHLTTFRLIILPNLLPAMWAGIGLGFARAIGEFGAVVLISGNIPFSTEVAAVRIFSQVEANNEPAAAAIAVVLLLCSLAVLLAIAALEHRSRKHES
ncbi:MAG: sulfate ABC transporter permease subunit CysT [Chloroflexota bacterium]|nr:sulfate ABC transporter permease subunit CysT [Chloroflexota bacterium]